MSYIIVTGPRGGNTAGADAPNRLDINDLVKIEDQFSLYVQAIARMYADDQSQLVSHFQIGGIHGLPYVAWDGSGGKEGSNPDDPNQWRGYCTHGMVTFPTWHRPYVALYEQTLQSHAIEIAKTYTEANGVRDRFMKAAQNLRAPFWDWASSAVPPAEVISLKQLNIIGPDGKTKSVNNPLLGYTFHPIDPSFPEPYAEWKMTLRHPVPQQGPNAKSNPQQLKSTMESEQEQITQKTYFMLTQLHTWPEFSNHTASEGASANSLEAIHDGIHVDVGGAGQMSDPSVAGFDPIFFMHHANVDRMLSLWRALNPDKWITPGNAEDGGSWTIPDNAQVDANTDLTPFLARQNDYWASSATTSTSEFGYTYPEFNGLNMGNPDSVQTAIADKVNQLYGGLVFASSAKGAAGIQPSDAQATFAAASVPASGNGQAPSAEGGDADGSARQLPPLPINPLQPGVSNSAVYSWVARVRVKKYEVGASFSVLFFLGKSAEIPEDPSAWRSSPIFVGGHHVFVNTVAGHCANCRNQRELVVEGYVHLDRAIARDGSSLGSFEPRVIVPYLKDNLQWRVQKNHGPAVALDQLPSLEITVAATPLTLEAGAQFPTPGETHFYPEITAGRPGGAREN
ncbi:unnamed protein product [Peniophora sp. CBMAI 1063]|nr:unnamed protein product [Peniophora sp. CBMAI 1063]